LKKKGWWGWKEREKKIHPRTGGGIAFLVKRETRSSGKKVTSVPTGKVPSSFWGARGEGGTAVINSSKIEKKKEKGGLFDEWINLLTGKKTAMPNPPSEKRRVPGGHSLAKEEHVSDPEKKG